MVAVVTEQKVIGRGATVYGQNIVLYKVAYSEDVPGVGRESFAVSVAGREGVVPFTAGFASVADVRRFLHSYEDETFTVHTADGQERSEVRRGLGVPKGMVTEIDGEVIEVPAPPSVTAVLDEPNNTPGTEQNPLTVPNDVAADDDTPNASTTGTATESTANIVPGVGKSGTTKKK